MGKLDLVPGHHSLELNGLEMYEFDASKLDDMECIVFRMHLYGTMMKLPNRMPTKLLQHMVQAIEGYYGDTFKFNNPGTPILVTFVYPDRIRAAGTGPVMNARTDHFHLMGQGCYFPYSDRTRW